MRNFSDGSLLLFRRIIGYNLSIETIGAVTGDVAFEGAVHIDDRQVIGVGRFKLVHHFHHLITGRNCGLDGRHYIACLEAPVEFCAEHHMSHSGDVDLTDEVVGCVDDRNEVATALADNMYQSSQWHIRADGRIFSFDNAVETHQREHGVVHVVCEQLSFACQSDGIDAMGLETADGDHCSHADDDKWYEQLIAARNLGDEEDSC